MNHENDLTPDEVRRLVRYDKGTGRLYWLARTPELFTDGSHKAAHTCAIWNAKFAGKEAFTANSRGYRTGAIFRKNYFAHRIAWAIHYGSWPSRHIDHVNGDPADNRIANLRDVGQSDNLRNASLRSDNRTGIPGVSWDRARGRWTAYISVDKRLSLGRYDSFAEAFAARKAAEKVLDYHANHGRLPRLKLDQIT